MDANVDSNIVFLEEITGTSRYRWICYLNIRVIEDTETGYINATKMCLMYCKTRNGEPKQFKQWKRQPSTHCLIELLQKPEDMLAPNLMFNIENSIINIRGTYVHRDLVPHIVLWCGITITDPEILEVCIKQQNQVKKQKVPNEGFVYILSAPMFSYYGDNVYKIGYTENLKRRMKQFIAIPERHYVYTKAVVSIDTEQKVHALLKPFRLFENEELFDVPLDIIIESIDTSLNVSMSNIRTNAKKQHDK